MVTETVGQVNKKINRPKAEGWTVVAAANNEQKNLIQTAAALLQTARTKASETLPKLTAPILSN